MRRKSIQPTDHIVLRKLTEKSKLGAHCRGFANKTVGEMLQYKRKYLLWVYYNIQSLTFTDEILDILNIFPEERIEKPGVNKDLYISKLARLQKWRIKNGQWGKVIVEKRIQKAVHDKYLGSAIADEALSKRVLQAINHGHRKA